MREEILIKILDLATQAMPRLHSSLSMEAALRLQKLVQSLAGRGLFLEVEQKRVYDDALDLLIAIRNDATAFFEDESDIEAYDLSGAIKDQCNNFLEKYGLQRPRKKVAQSSECLSYYVVTVEGGVEPSLHGPHTEAKRDDEAKRLHSLDDPECDSIFWLNAPEGGPVEIGSYSGGFFKDEQDAADGPPMSTDPPQP